MQAINFMPYLYNWTALGVPRPAYFLLRIYHMTFWINELYKRIFNEDLVIPSDIEKKDGYPIIKSIRDGIVGNPGLNPEFDLDNETREMKLFLRMAASLKLQKIDMKQYKNNWKYNREGFIDELEKKYYIEVDKFRTHLIEYRESEKLPYIDELFDMYTEESFGFVTV